MKKFGFINAFGVFAYVALVSLVMSNGDRLFGKTDNFMSPIAFLLLFCLSALTVGSLVLGKPLLLYLDDKKKEAVALFLNTTAWLAIFTVVALIATALIR